MNVHCRNLWSAINPARPQLPGRSIDPAFSGAQNTARQHRFQRSGSFVEETGVMEPDISRLMIRSVGHFS
jgi:hypothetical protein